MVSVKSITLLKQHDLRALYLRVKDCFALLKQHDLRAPLVE
jgi:hypothetical protein